MRFLTIARGSLFEVLSAARIARELTYLPAGTETEMRQAAGKINAKLMALIKSLDPGV